MILPVLCLTALSFATITRQTRASMLDVLENDYIRTSRAKGASEKSVYNKHALRNALIPTVTIAINRIGGILAGSAIIEMTFNYKGIGYGLVKAIETNDYWMIIGIVIVIGVINIFSNLIADIIYTIIDPRIVYE